MVKASFENVEKVVKPPHSPTVRNNPHEVLSSHSARKAFAGNMYKNVKDPNLVCALTGHKEGSKAFKIEWDLGSYAISLNP